MKLAEIKELSTDEIYTEIKKAQLDLSNLKMKFASRQLDDPSQIKKKRKEIAWLFTIQTLKSKEAIDKPQEKSGKPMKVKKDKSQDAEKRKTKHKERLD